MTIETITIGIMTHRFQCMSSAVQWTCWPDLFLSSPGSVTKYIRRMRPLEHPTLGMAVLGPLSGIGIHPPAVGSREDRAPSPYLQGEIVSHHDGALARLCGLLWWCRNLEHRASVHYRSIRTFHVEEIFLYNSSTWPRGISIRWVIYVPRHTTSTHSTSLSETQVPFYGMFVGLVFSVEQCVLAITERYCSCHIGFQSILGARMLVRGPTLGACIPLTPSAAEYPGDSYITDTNPPVCRNYGIQTPQQQIITRGFGGHYGMTAHRFKSASLSISSRARTSWPNCRSACTLQACYTPLSSTHNTPLQLDAMLAKRTPDCAGWIQSSCGWVTLWRHGDIN